MSMAAGVWRAVAVGLLLVTPSRFAGAQVAPCLPLPEVGDDSTLAATVLASGALSRATVQRPLLAMVRSSVVTAQGDRIGVVVVRTNIDDVDVAALFVNRCLSRPTLRGTASVPQLEAGAVEVWNELVSAAEPRGVPADSQTAVALALLFLSFGTGHFVPLPAEVGESTQSSGRSGDAITRTRVRDVSATCAAGRCSVAGTWQPVSGVALPFLVVVRDGGLIEMPVVQLPFAPPSQ